MEDFEPLTFGWYRRSDPSRIGRQFFYYIEESRILAGEAELRLPRPLARNLFADAAVMAFVIVNYGRLHPDT